MNPSPAPASVSHFNIADLFTKSLPNTTHRRFVSLIGADPAVDTLASATPPSTVDPSATVDFTTTNSVPTLHPNPTLPIVLDTGAPFSIIPFASDFKPSSIRIDSVCRFGRFQSQGCLHY